MGIIIIIIIIVVYQDTKFEVRRPSRSEDMADFQPWR